MIAKSPLGPAIAVLIIILGLELLFGRQIALAGPSGMEAPDLQKRLPVWTGPHYGEPGASLAPGAWLFEAHARVGYDQPLNNGNMDSYYFAATDAPGRGALRGSNFRVRFQVYNDGDAASVWRPQLEWTASGLPWAALPLSAGASPFFVADTARFASGATIPVAAFGLGPGTGAAEPGFAFDAANPAPPITLDAGSYMELEFNIRATALATFYTAYGFRLTDAGTPLDGWSSTAWASVWEPPNPGSPHYGYSPTTDKCASCHRVHVAAGPSLTLAPAEEQVCYSCHDGTGARTNIYREFAEASVHPVAATTGVHSPSLNEGLGAGWNTFPRHVECQDCHTPHATSSNTGAATPGFGDYPKNIIGQWGLTVANPSTPFVGVTPDLFTRTDAPVAEYQLCFKCHSSYAYLNNPPSLLPVPFTETDLPGEFNVNNVSYHWVETDQTALTGQTPPLSAPGRMASFTPGTPFTAGTPMNCTDCHNAPDPASPRGPHGSNNPFILKDTWSRTQYGLCLECHDPAVYGPLADPSTTAATGFGNPGKPDLHGLHLAKTATVQGCQDCHVAIPHGWNARALLAQTTDPAPYNNGSRLLVVTWPASGDWQMADCSTDCH